MNKARIDICIDGKAHAWMRVAAEAAGDGLSLEHHWCEKCGCLTQVGVDADGNSVQALDESGRPHFVAPEYIDDLING